MLINDFTVANWRILRMFDNRTCETDSINSKILNYNYTIDKCFALKFLNFGGEENSGSRQDT